MPKKEIPAIIKCYDCTGCRHSVYLPTVGNSYWNISDLPKTKQSGTCSAQHRVTVEYVVHTLDHKWHGHLVPCEVDKTVQCRDHTNFIPPTRFERILAAED